MATRRDKPGHWTIHDVAREAGVSAKTVSRVVNGEPGVGEATRLRVAQIIQEVGYQPHTGARSMRSHKRDCVGVAFPAPVNVVPLSQGFFLWLFNALYRTFGVQGNFICFDPSPPGSVSDYARGLWQQRYQACVICGPLAVDDKVAARVHDSGHPYLVFGRLDSLPELQSATVDYEAAARQSTSYLIRRGHRRIAMLKAFSGYQPAVERVRGYRQALEEAGLPFDEALIRSATFTTTSLVETVHRLLVDSSVTALIDCSAAEDGRSLREGLRRAGRTPGKDVDVLCWTYTDNAAVLTEACAHVWLPVHEAAAEGLELFAKWYYGEEEVPIRVLYPPTLYERVDYGEIAKPRALFDLLG